MISSGKYMWSYLNLTTLLEGIVCLIVLNYSNKILTRVHSRELAQYNTGGKSKQVRVRIYERPNKKELLKD